MAVAMAKPMTQVAAIVAAILWFVLTGLLWYAKPPGAIWLIGSLALGLVWFTGFLWYVTRPSKS